MPRAGFEPVSQNPVMSGSGISNPHEDGSMRGKMSLLPSLNSCKPAVEIGV